MKECSVNNVSIEFDSYGDVMLSAGYRSMELGQKSDPDNCKDNAINIVRCLIKGFDINLADLMGE